MALELTADRKSLKVRSKDSEVEWKVDETGKFFDGILVLYQRIRLTKDEWEGKRQKVNEIIALKKRSD